MLSWTKAIRYRLGVGLVFATTGCGSSLTPDYGKLDLVNVSGSITLDGQPLPEAIVVFESNDATFSYGRTDDSGNYTLMLNSEKSGVMPGPKIVRIRTSGGTWRRSRIDRRAGRRRTPDGRRGARGARSALLQLAVEIAGECRQRLPAVRLRPQIGLHCSDHTVTAAS